MPCDGVEVRGRLPFSTVGYRRLRPSSLRLRRRIQLLAAAFVLLLGFNLVFAITLNRRNDHQAVVVDRRLQPARNDVAALFNALVNQETGLRAYIITGQDSQLLPYQNGRAAAARALQHMEELLNADPTMVERVAVAGQAIAAWQSQVAEPEIAARRSGRPGDAERLVAAEPTLGLFDAASARINEVQRGVAIALTAAESSRARARTDLTRALIATFAAAIVLLFIARMLVSRWVNRPLDDLSRSVRQVAGGDLDHKIVPIGPPDLVELGAGVEAMRKRILTELDDADRARGALARRGLVVLKLRDELAPSAAAIPDSIDLASRFDPAEGILAGDWWDVVVLDGGVLGFALVDVAGHGAATGVFALRTKQLVLAALRVGLSPGDALAWVRDQLGDSGELFFSAFIARIDPVTGVTHYASAGHPDTFLTDGAGQLRRLTFSGPVCGPIPGGWQTITLTIETGWTLVAYTDGLSECRDAHGEELGIDRLADVVAHAGVSAAAAADAAFSAAQEHRGGRFVDDATIVALARR